MPEFTHDCSLIFPPGFHPGQPFLALPQLKSFIKDHGYHSKIYDFNLEAFHYFLEPTRAEENLKWAICHLIDLQDKDQLFSHERKKLPFLNYALQFGKEQLRQLSKSIEVFNNKDFYQQDLFLESKKNIHFFYRLACLQYGDSIFSFEVYYPHDGVHSPKKLLRNIKSSSKNLFYKFLQEQVSLLDFKVKVIGINASTRGQFHSALTLAYLLKKNGYLGDIIMGGSYITRLFPKRDLLKQNFMAIVDYFSFFEGEFNLLSLLQGNLGSSTSLLSKDTIYESKTPPVTNHHNPDFSDLNLDRYFSPDIVLPFQIRRGCIYGKCIFCEHPVFMESENKNRESPHIKSLVNSILALSKDYQTPYIYFIDEMILPLEMDEISQNLLESTHKIEFICYSYFSTALLKEGRISLWKKAGLKKMWMGLESFDPLVLRNMKKFRPNDSVEKCLTLFKQENLPVHLFLLLGFPGETPKSLDQTIEKLISFQDKLDSVFFSADLFCYTVYINSEAYTLRDKLQIEVFPQGELDIGITKWKLHNGLSSNDVQSFVDDSIKKLRGVFNTNHKTDINLLELNCLQDSTHLLYISHHEKMLK
ncbi:MAG: radical SAM protein [Candidatus Cloacimonetes bacterium]|nr:radical SAM protein [Candidatus Cloacimonadota bacterium]